MRTETVLKIIGWALVATGACVLLVGFGGGMGRFLTGGIPGMDRGIALLLFLVLAGLGAALLVKADNLFLRKALSSRGDRELDRIFDALPSRRHSQLFHLAAIHGNHELVKRLIARGVNVNAIEKGSASSPTAGSTALFEAAAAGHADIIEVLIASGADVDLGVVADSAHPEDYEQGECPLKVALQQGHREVAGRLVEHGADLYLVNSNYDVTAELNDDLDSVVLASARRLRDEGKAHEALPIYEELISRLDRDHAASVPSDVLVVLREFAETHEMNGNRREALDFYCHALRMWQQRRVPSAGAVRLFDRKPVDREPFSEVALEELVNEPGADRNEIAALLRDCERILGRLGMTEEHGRVAAALKQLGKAS